MNPNIDPRQRVLVRLRDAGAAAELIEHAEKMGYGKDSAMWEFADMLGLVAEMMQKIPAEIERVSQGALGKTKTIQAALLTDTGIAAELIEHAEKMGYGKDSAMWEFTDMLGLVAARLQSIPIAVEKASQLKLINTRPAQQKTVITGISWPATIASSGLIGVVVFFAAGTNMPLIQISTGIALGIAIGVVGTMAALFYFGKNKNVDVPTINESFVGQAKQNSARWTSDEFNRAAEHLKLSKRTLEACFDVLINGDDEGLVKQRYGLFLTQLGNGLRQFQAEKAKLKQ